MVWKKASGTANPMSTTRNASRNTVENGDYDKVQHNRIRDKPMNLFFPKADVQRGPGLPIHISFRFTAGTAHTHVHGADVYRRTIHRLSQYAHLDLVCSQYDRISEQRIKHKTSKNGRCDVWIDCGERIIQQLNVSPTVRSPCQTDPLPLATAQRHAALADQRAVTVWQDLDVRL